MQLYIHWVIFGSINRFSQNKWNSKLRGGTAISNIWKQKSKHLFELTCLCKKLTITVVKRSNSINLRFYMLVLKAKCVYKDGIVYFVITLNCSAVEKIMLKLVHLSCLYEITHTRTEKNVPCYHFELRSWKSVPMQSCNFVSK